LQTDDGYAPGHEGQIRYIHCRYQGRSLGQLPLDDESAEFHRRYAELLDRIQVKARVPKGGPLAP